MKDLIFVTCLYFHILLVQCDIVGNNLNGPDPRIKMCIQKTINHLFSQNDTLSLILNSNELCEDAIFEASTMRPYMVLNMDDINNINKLQYDGQFIICPKDVHSLYRTLRSTHHITSQRYQRNMGSSKVLVITNATDTSSMFNILWSHHINNGIILVYGQGTSKLFTCNRHAPENKCGKARKLMIHQDCEEQLSVSFTSVIRQMNKCPITFLFQENTMYEQETFPYTRVIQYIIVELSHHLNATFQRAMGNETHEFNYWSTRRGMLVISPGDIFCWCDMTEGLISMNSVWLVPKARRISNMNVCVKVFSRDVWIATSIVFICVTLIWCLIISCNGGFTFDKFCISFLNVWSLTIFGNVARIPRSRSFALRIILLFYFFYAMQMQFAFTSDMSTVLTAPQYDFQIRNLIELADSQLPIYTYDIIKSNSFMMNFTDRKLYTKLQNAIHVTTIKESQVLLVDLQHHGNYAIITTRGDIHKAEIDLNRTVEAYEIMDSSIIPPYDIRLGLLINHYFTTTLNTFVNKMIQSGIHEKRKNDFFRVFDAENVDTTPEDDLLTLKHLTFIFVLFGFGLCTACVVFCFELVLHKYL